MPGRFAITMPPEAIRGFFAYFETPDFPPRFNIAPTQPIPVVTSEPHSAGRKRHFILMRWGFLPGFVKSPNEFPLLINARSESLLEKASFRAAVKRRRCLIIADGFYEWRRTGKTKTPFLIRRVNGEPMGFAGLYETWSDPSGGEIDTACIVTTPANRLIRYVHDRMPAILPQENFSYWLDNDGVEAGAACGLLAPAAEDALELVEIGDAVNKYANDDAAVQAPVAAPLGIGDIRN
jgi:putative SOS response-associated peptidase YedK